MGTRKTVIFLFSTKQFCLVCISSMYIYKEPPEAVLSVNFGLFGGNFLTSFISGKKDNGKSVRGWFYKDAK